MICYAGLMALLAIRRSTVQFGLNYAVAKWKSRRAARQLFDAFTC